MRSSPPSSRSGIAEDEDVEDKERANAAPEDEEKSNTGTR